MNGRVTQGSRLVLLAAVRLLVILSAAFLVYEVRLRAVEPSFHPLYGFFRYAVGLLTLRPGVTPTGIPTAFYVRPALLRSAALLTAASATACAVGYGFARWNFVHARRRALLRIERVGSIAYALPIAALAMVFFAIAAETGWFPIGGTTSTDFSSLGPVGKALDVLHHAALPWLTLTLFPALMLIRSGVRAVDELRDEDYLSLARSHGFPDVDLFRLHARKPVLGRLLTDLSAQLPLIVTYLVIVELVFRYTGVGYYTVQPYSGFWGSRGPDVFAVSQAALVYVGAGTVLAQLLLRLATVAAVPRMRTLRLDGVGGQRSAALAMVAFATAGAGLIALTIGEGAGLAADAVRRGIALIGALGFVAALTVWRRADGAAAGPDARIANREPSDARTAFEAPVASAGMRPVLRGSAFPTGRAIAWVLLAVLVLLPWLVRPPNRPPRFLLARPDFVEHPELVWYFFARTFVTGRFLLVVLVTTAAGALVGVILGALAGYYGAGTVDRAVSCVEVVPSLLVAALVAGISASASAPVTIAVAVAAAVSLYAPARRIGNELTGAEFTTYGRAIGETRLEELRRHLAPNLAVRLGPRFPSLYGDMIVLTVNLGFLRLTPVGGADERAGVVVDFFSAIGREWGGQIAQGRSDFIRGTYLPTFWPILFLIGTALLVKSLGGRDR